MFSFLHSTKFQYFFMDSKVNCQIHITDMFINIWKEYFIKECFWSERTYFTHVILSFSSPRCAIIAHLNVIYTKFWRVMIAQLNKIWCMWAYVHAVACHSWPDVYSSIIVQLCFKYPESFPSSLFCQLNLVKGAHFFTLIKIWNIK